MKKIIRLLTLALLTVPVTTFAQSEGNQNTSEPAGKDIQNVRIYFTGYNLLCFTNYSGYDPEVDTSSKRNPMTPGIDYAAYPKSRTFVGGINVTF